MAEAFQHTAPGGELSDRPFDTGVVPTKGRRLLRAASTGGWGQDAAQELIGRQQEFSLLARFLASLVAGPRALLVEGEAGIGKTALWQAGLAQARACGQRTLACRPAGSEVKLSFAALGDLLAGALQEALPALPVPQRRALEAALLLAEPEGEPPDQRAIGLALLNVLRALTLAGPLLVAIDDAQWLDQPSAAVLAFALRRLAAEPVGVLATVRLAGGEEPPAVALEPWLLAERLCLGPLTLAAVHELLRTRLAVSPSRPTLVRLHQAAGGNPFFALELGRALLEQGREPAPDEPLPVPAGLRALVRARLARLPASARDSLLAVAALSRPAVALAMAAAGGGERALADLDRAARAGVIARKGERIRFTHPLLASTLYGEASLSQRRGLHRRLAGLVTDGEERARHLALAAEGPDVGIAAALEEAAAEAHLRGAPDAAAALCEQACALTPADRPGELRRRGREAASYHLLAGNTSRARALLEQAVSSMAPGDQRARRLHRLGQVHYHEDSWATAEDFLARALAEAGDNPSLRCEILQGLAFARHVRGDIPARRGTRPRGAGAC
jgi:predicted ATPase